MSSWLKTALLTAAALVLFLGGCRKHPDASSSAGEQQVSAAKTETDAIPWLTDFEAAKKKAADEGKDLLMNFTGSDWCGWCMALDEEVFSQKPFVAEAQLRFVFVKIDFPRKITLPAALKKQNERLAEQYQVQGFPTIILADPSGKAYAQTGYQEGGPTAYLQHLAQLRLQKPAK